MKIPTQCFSVALLAAGLLSGLSSCRDEKKDAVDISNGIALKTMVGTYVYSSANKEDMTLSIYEWRLDDNTTDGKVGYYRVVRTGNGVEEDTTDSLIWSATPAEDNLSMQVSAVFENQKQDLTWKNGVLYLDDYTTAKTAGSQATYLRTLNDQFANVTYAYNDTTYVMKLDTVYYLAWKTNVVFALPEDTTAKIQELYDTYIKGKEDTLQWFLNEFPNAGIPSQITVADQPSSRGINKGNYGITYPESYQTFKMDLVNVGYKRIVNSEMVFNRADKKNTGSFSYQERNWSDDCYFNPEVETAVYTDSLFEVTDAVWSPVAITNARKFDVALYGTRHVERSITVAGEVQTPEQALPEDQEVLFQMPFASWNTSDGSIEYNETKYKLKQ